MPLPTDKQREVWDRFAEASRESAEATADLEGTERMVARWKQMRDELSQD